MSHLLDGIEVDASEYDLLVKHHAQLLRIVKMVVRVADEAAHGWPQQITLRADCALFQDARGAMAEEEP